MIDFLYNMIIFPLVQIIEISFVIFYRIFRSRGFAIIGVSAVFTVCTMPLYFIAEKWQQSERDIQKKLKPKIDKIKAVFKGDEQYMILSAYYRQNHYHPVYALRSSLSILFQIPFFIAAYSYLSHLDYINGQSFFFIKNLGAPDGLFSLAGFSINILPVLMTLINCASGAVYTRGLAARDKIQIYGMALIFLVLLYNSPAGLVLYWTMNNVFSLIKNILSKTKHSLKIVYITLCFCALLVIVRFIPMGFSPKRLFVAGFCSLIFFVPLFIKLFRFIEKKASKMFIFAQSSLASDGTYIFSALILFILAGLVIPGSLIASSVQEFSFLDSYTNPLPLIYPISIQAMGLFLFWPLCIYFLFPQKIKYVISLIYSLICAAALVNTFLFPGDFGFITTTLRFSSPDTFESNYFGIVLNGIFLIFILGLFTFLLVTKRKIIFHSFQIIVVTALSFMCVFNIIKINKDFQEYDDLLKLSSKETSHVENTQPVFNFSRNGKNVIVFMLDAAISGYIPYIFNEKPELLECFSGFVYYPNCVSFGSHTRIGAPLIFGGYEYEPLNIQKNRSYAMKKHNEALLMLPRIFSGENYRVTVTDPAFANYSLKPDLSIFTPYPEINARNIIGNYTDIWLRSHSDLQIISVPELLNELLIRFSLLKIAPSAFRVFIYDKSKWLKPDGNIYNNQISLNILDNYTTLDYFPLLTEITDDTFNTYTSIVNELPHDPALLQYPDYIPSAEVTEDENAFFTRQRYYHVNIASILLTGKWLRFLQEQGIYDNTRIIIASDHGRNVNDNYTGNMRLPDGNRLSSYHALLLVKDFDARGNIVTDNAFMTHGDVPLIAMEDLIENPINPFSGASIEANKENGIFIATTSSLDYIIPDDHWLYVHDDIFDISNWKAVIK